MFPFFIKLIQHFWALLKKCLINLTKKVKDPPKKEKKMTSDSFFLSTNYSLEVVDPYLNI
jgi:hypothetical protein